MRLFLKIVMGLIVIVVLLAAVLLIPPHMQTHRVEPPLPSEAELRALLAVENGPVGVRYLNTSSQRGPDSPNSAPVRTPSGGPLVPSGLGLLAGEASS